MALYKSEGLRIATYAKGSSGKGISQIKNYYYASNSDKAPEKSANWKELISELDPPFNGTYKYLWNYEEIIYTEGEPTKTDSMILGTWGPGFDDIYEYYIITATDSAPSAPQQEDGTWPDTQVITGVGTWIKANPDVSIPNTTKDKPYLWNFEVLNFNDGTDQKFGPTCIGTYGNSISTTTEYYYATAERGEQAPERYLSGTNINTDKWKTKISETTHSATCPFLWNFERTTFSMSEPQDTEVTLLSSEPRSIKQITEYYQILPSKPSTGATAQEGDTNCNLSPIIARGWDTAKPDLDQGETLWNFEVIEYSASDENGKNLFSWTEPTSVGYMGLDGTSFIGITRRYKVSTTEAGKPTDGYGTDGFVFNEWGSATPAEAGFNETNKFLWCIEKIETSEGSNYTPIELSAIWSKDGAEGRHYISSKYFYYVNNSSGSYEVDPDMDINTNTGEPTEKSEGKWKDDHSELLEGQALWVAEYQNFSKPKTGETKTWEPLPVRLLSYVGTNGIGESGVSLTASSYFVKSTDTDTNTIHIERNLFGEAATDTTLNWKWGAQIGGGPMTEITSTNTQDNIYKSSDNDDLYVKPAAFTSNKVDTILIKIQDSTNKYYDYTSLKMVEDGKDAYIAFLNNPHAGMSADQDGNVTTSTQIATNVIVLKGSEPQQVTLGPISSDLFNIKAVDGNTTNKQAAVAATVKGTGQTGKSNLGSSSSCSGHISIPITSPIKQTLTFNWTKTNSGKDGDSARILELTNDGTSIDTDVDGKLNLGEGQSISFETIAQVYEGGEPSSDWTYSIDSYSGTGYTVSQQSGTFTFTFTDEFNSTEYKNFTISATKDGVASPSPKVFSVTKNKTGATGQAAVVYEIVPSVNVINVDNTNTSSFTFEIHKITGGNKPEVIEKFNDPAFISVTYQNTDPIDSLEFSPNTGKYTVNYTNDISKQGIIISMTGYKSESIPFVKNGDDSTVEGPQGPTSVQVKVYMLTNSIYTPPSPSEKPSSGGVVNEWVTDPSIMATRDYSYVYEASITKIENSLTNQEEWIANGSTPKLIRAWTNIEGVSQESRAQFEIISNFGVNSVVAQTKDGIIIQAGQAENGIGLYVLKDQVNIAGWEAKPDRLSKGNIGENNSMFLSPTGIASNKNIGNGGTTSKNWVITAGTNFGVTNNGNVYASQLFATGGTIGTWNLGTIKSDLGMDWASVFTNALWSVADASKTGEIVNYYTILRASDNSANIAFGIKRESKKLVPVRDPIVEDVFYVNHRGELYASAVSLGLGELGTDNSIRLNTTNMSGTINGVSQSNWRLTVGSYFGVTANGETYASKGKIGGWDLTTNTFHHYGSTITETSEGNTYYAQSFGLQVGSGIYAIAIGNLSSSDWGKGAFKVTHDGVLYADGAILTGDFTTSSQRQAGTSNGQPIMVDVSASIKDGELLINGTSTYLKLSGSQYTATGTDYLYQDWGEFRYLSLPWYQSWAYRRNLNGEFKTVASLGLTTGRGDPVEASDMLLMMGNWKVYGNLYNSGGAIAVGSDKNLKNSINYVDKKYDILFDNLIPRTFKYNDGTSNRLHTGFIAQEAAQAAAAAEITLQDFAAVCIYKSNDNFEEWSLRYGEFVALNTWQIQKLKPRMTAAEIKIQLLENEIISLKSELENLKNSQNSAII